MIVLNNIVTEFSVGSVPEYSPKKRRRVDAETQRSNHHHNVIPGRNGQHINIPPDGIESSSLIVKPLACEVVYEEKPEVINRGKDYLVPLHPDVF